MKDNEVFSIIAQCFAPITQDQWESLTMSSVWSAFIAEIQCLMQDEKTFDDRRKPVGALDKQSLFQDFSSKGKIEALLTPPTYEEKQSFAARHFTGGLPESAVPVESLYVTWSQTGSSSPFSRVDGMYRSDTAFYMRDLIKRLGLELPESFASHPDHLVIELDLVAVMLRSEMQSNARSFLTERFNWLKAYRRRLLELSDDASFYIGLIDVVLGIRAQQRFMVA